MQLGERLTLQLGQIAPFRASTIPLDWFPRGRANIWLIGHNTLAPRQGGAGRAIRRLLVQVYEFPALVRSRQIRGSYPAALESTNLSQWCTASIQRMVPELERIDRLWVRAPCPV